MARIEGKPIFIVGGADRVTHGKNDVAVFVIGRTRIRGGAVQFHAWARLCYSLKFAPIVGTITV